MGNCIGTTMSHVLSVSERFAMWISACSMITYMILCLFVMLGFGVGLGYNYSFVDYRSKQVYVQGSYKKVSPTNYYGPGYYKPTTRDPSLRPRTRSKARLIQRASKHPELIEVVRGARGPAEDSPSDNPAELAKAEIAPPARLNVRHPGPLLEHIYFESKTKPTKRRFIISKLNKQFNVSLPRTNEKNETEVKTDFNYKSPKEFDHINSNEDIAGAEAIRVDVAKVSDVDDSSIVQTMMNLKQLLSFLSRLREDKKRFSVQVITL